MGRITRSDRIIYRQAQCTRCKFDSEVKIKDRLFGFCSKQNKRYCDMDIWEDCPYFSEKMSKKDLKRFLEQGKYQERLDRAIGEVLAATKCVPYCLNGKYR